MQNGPLNQDQIDSFLEDLKRRIEKRYRRALQSGMVGEEHLDAENHTLLKCVTVLEARVSAPVSPAGKALLKNLEAM